MNWSGRWSARGQLPALLRRVVLPRLQLTSIIWQLFEYRVSYRRLLEIQSRLLARVLEGEIGEYPVFTTR